MTCLSQCNREHLPNNITLAIEWAIQWTLFHIAFWQISSQISLETVLQWEDSMQATKVSASWNMAWKNMSWSAGGPVILPAKSSWTTFLTSTKEKIFLASLVDQDLKLWCLMALLWVYRFKNWTNIKKSFAKIKD